MHIAPDHHRLQLYLVKFVREVQPLVDTLNPAVKQLIQEFLSVHGASLAESTHKFVEANRVGGSLAQRLGAAQALYLLHNDKKEEAIKIATNLTGAKGYADVQEAVSIYHSLTSFFADEQAAKEYKASAHKTFEYASEFMEEEQLKARKEAVKPKVEAEKEPEKQ